MQCLINLYLYVPHLEWMLLLCTASVTAVCVNTNTHTKHTFATQKQSLFNVGYSLVQQEGKWRKLFSSCSLIHSLQVRSLITLLFSFLLSLSLSLTLNFPFPFPFRLAFHLPLPQSFLRGTKKASSLHLPPRIMDLLIRRTYVPSSAYVSTTIQFFPRTSNTLKIYTCFR